MKKKKPTISEHGVFSLTFYTCLIYICSTFQDGQKNCSHCVRVINDSLECKEVAMRNTRSLLHDGAFRTLMEEKSVEFLFFFFFFLRKKFDFVLHKLHRLAGASTGENRRG